MIGDFEDSVMAHLGDRAGPSKFTVGDAIFRQVAEYPALRVNGQL